MVRMSSDIQENSCGSHEHLNKSHLATPLLLWRLSKKCQKQIFMTTRGCEFKVYHGLFSFTLFSFTLFSFTLFSFTLFSFTLFSFTLFSFTLFSSPPPPFLPSLSFPLFFLCPSFPSPYSFFALPFLPLIPYYLQYHLLFFFRAKTD